MTYEELKCSGYPDCTAKSGSFSKYGASSGQDITQSCIAAMNAFTSSTLKACAHNDVQKGHAMELQLCHKAQWVFPACPLFTHQWEIQWVCFHWHIFSTAMLFAT